MFPWYAIGSVLDRPSRRGSATSRSIASTRDNRLPWSISRRRGVGISNENQWWGPGISNALILSNNAPGFPHAFVRTAHPWKTPLG